MINNRHSFWRYSTVLALVGLFLALGVVGCGGGGGGGGGSAAGGQSATPTPPAPTTATLQLDFNLASRTVPVDVRSFRVTGYSQTGERVYGPVLRAKASRIVLADVPVQVASLRLEYLDAGGTPVGLYVEAVELQPGATWAIVDPPYEDFADPPSLSRVEVSPAAGSVAAGLQLDFTAVAIFVDGFRQVLTEDARWSVGDGNLASASNAPGTRGRVEGRAPGATTVIATYAGKSGQANLTVTAADLVSLAVTPVSASVPAGRTQQFAATGTFTDNSTADLTSQVTWSSSDQNVAAVENFVAREAGLGGVSTPGLATGVATGQTTITATHVGTGKFASAALTVTTAVLVSLEVKPAYPSVPKGRTQQFTSTGTFSDQTTRDLTAQADWTSLDEGTASVSNLAGSRGLASTHKEGRTSITATDPASGLQGTTAITVTAAELVSLSVTPADPSIPLGRTQQFAATGTFTDGTTMDLTRMVAWSSSATGVATIGNAGDTKALARGAGVGQTTIQAIDYSTQIHGSTTLTVTDARLVTLVVTPASPHAPVGRTQQFTATGTFSDNSAWDLTADVTWSSSSEATASISNAAGSKGLATAAATGQTIITATDPLSGLHNTATFTVTPAVLASIAVTPVDQCTGTGATLQFTATGIYTDGARVDITATVVWSSSDTGVANISNAEGSKGLATAGAVGSTIITATDLTSGIAGETWLAVLGP